MSDTSLAMQEEASPQPRLRDALTPRTVLILAIALFTNVTLYMVHPFFVIYFKQTLGFSTPEAGLLVGLPFVSAILFGVVGGYLSDRTGVLRTFTLAMVVYAVSVGAVAFTHSFVLVAVLMLVSGLAIPVMSSGISSLLNESAQPEHRGLLQNYLYWINNVGVALGLLVSAELLHAGHSNVPLLVFGIVRLLLCVAILIFFRGKHSESSESAAAAPKRLSMLATFKFVGTDKALLYASCTFLLLMVIESQMDATMPLYFAGHFHNGVALYAPIVTINAVVLVACQPLAVKLFSKKKPVPVFAIGALCTGVGMALGGVVGTVWAWVAGMVLYSLGEVIWATKLNDLIGELPTSGNSTLYFSTIRTAINFAFFIGLTLGSIVYRVLGAPALFGSMAVLGVITIPLFRAATTAYRRRVLRDMANADVVAECTLPGTELAVNQPTVEKHVIPEGLSPITQRAASFIPLHESHGESAFGIPTAADRRVFLQNLSLEQWERILTYTEVQRFTPGEMVVSMGESDRSVYVVMAGQLEVLVPADANGSTHRRLTVIEAGLVFGEQSFVDGRPRSASIRATTEGELRKLDWQAFAALSRDEGELGQRVMTDLARILSERLRQTTEYVNLMYSV